MPGYITTSNTEAELVKGEKTFTVNTPNLSYIKDDDIWLATKIAPTEAFLQGKVIAYYNTTNVIVVNVIKAFGDDVIGFAIDDWTIDNKDPRLPKENIILNDNFTPILKQIETDPINTYKKYQENPEFKSNILQKYNENTKDNFQKLTDLRINYFSQQKGKVKISSADPRFPELNRGIEINSYKQYLDITGKYKKFNEEIKEGESKATLVITYSQDLFDEKDKAVFDLFRKITIDAISSGVNIIKTPIQINKGTSQLNNLKNDVKLQTNIINNIFRS
jgi:hypothetical protein